MTDQFDRSSIDQSDTSESESPPMTEIYLAVLYSALGLQSARRAFADEAKARVWSEVEIESGRASTYEIAIVDFDAD